MTQEPGAVFEAIYDSGTPGLAGTLAVAIQDNQNVVVFGPTVLDIIELTVGGNPTGVYRAMLTAPVAVGQYTIFWSNDGSFDPGTGADEDLIVAVESLTLPALGAGVGGSVLCSAWTTEDDVIVRCLEDKVVIGTSDPLLDASIAAASEVLYDASGKQHVGVCERTVRPCETYSRFCGITQVLSRGHIVDWQWNWDRGCWGGYNCGCQPLSRVKLAGYVNEIVEVLIDGAVVNPVEYRVDENRWLVRMDGRVWPACQIMDRDESEDGTFAVTYTYGKVPPVLGQLAAAQLACEIYKSMIGAECALPVGTTRIARQGITVERTFLQRNRDGVWQTGVALVDLFLNTVNPHGLVRRATVWSASRANRYARPAG